MYATNNTTATVTGYANATSVTKLPEVAGEIETQRMALEHLEDAATKLEDRLSAILALREVAGAQQTGQPEPVRVPLAGTLHDHTARVAMVTMRLSSMLERVEL